MSGQARTRVQLLGQASGVGRHGKKLTTVFSKKFCGHKEIYMYNQAIKCI